MAEAVVTTVVPDTTTAPPVGAADETAEWAALKEEIEADQEPAIEERPPAVVELERPEKVEPQAKPEPTPEELKANYTNLQKALQAEREEKRQYVQRLQNYDDFIKQLRDSRQTQEPAKEPEKKAPNLEEDPIGFFTHQIEGLQKQLQQATQGSQQTAQQLQAQNEQQQFWGQVERSEQEIRNPKSPNHKADYDPAIEYLENRRVAQLARMYPDEAPAVQHMARQYGLPSPAHLRIAILNQDRTAVAAQAMQMNMSPAALYYDLAVGEGYTAKPVDGKTNGATQITAARAGQKAAKTLSGGTGTGRKDDLSLTGLAELYAEDPDEFDKQWEKMAAAGQLG